MLKESYIFSGPEHEVNDSPPSTAEVNNEWSYE
jgi:hypothetical protein